MSWADEESNSETENPKIPEETISKTKVLTPPTPEEGEDDDEELLDIEEIVKEMIQTPQVEVDQLLGAAEVERNTCHSHLAQLAVNNAIKGSKFVTDLVAKVNTLVTFFTRHSHIYSKLKEKTGGLCLLKPVDTRWNSQYHCFKRLCREIKSEVMLFNLLQLVLKSYFHII